MFALIRRTCPDDQRIVVARRLTGRPERPRALPALGCDSDIGGQSGGHRHHAAALRPGAGAALPEGAWPQMSGQSIANPAAAPTPTPTPDPAPGAGTVATGGWTGAVRRRAVRALPPDKLLPDTQPAYMASWIYVFGVLTLAAFVVVLASGTVLALRGP